MFGTKDVLVIVNEQCESEVLLFWPLSLPTLFVFFHKGLFWLRQHHLFWFHSLRKGRGLQNVVDHAIATWHNNNIKYYNSLHITSSHSVLLFSTSQLHFPTLPPQPPRLSLYFKLFITLPTKNNISFCYCQPTQNHFSPSPINFPPWLPPSPLFFIFLYLTGKIHHCQELTSELIILTNEAQP